MGVLRAATSSSPSDDAVSIHPGATELAVTPWRPYSSAIERMTPSIAPFEPPYPACRGEVTIGPVTDEIITTRPYPRAAIPGRAAWVV